MGENQEVCSGQEALNEVHPDGSYCLESESKVPCVIRVDKVQRVDEEPGEVVVHHKVDALVAGQTWMVVVEGMLIAGDHQGTYAAVVEVDACGAVGTDDWERT